MSDDAVQSNDPSVLGRLVVHAEDVVTAYEARERSGKPAVLRLTPPFSARMRARIHVSQPGEYDDQPEPHPIHVEPGDLLGPDCPDYPEPDETATAVDGDREAHHDYHLSAVEEWRERTRGCIRDSLTLPEAGGRLTVAVLG